MPTYSLLSGIDAWQRLEDDGREVTVLKSRSPLRVKAVHSGQALFDIKYALVYVPVFAPTLRSAPPLVSMSILQPQDAGYTQVTSESGSNLTIVEQGSQFPASGFLRRNCAGAITASALQIETEDGQDVWVFRFRSLGAAYRWTAARDSLALAHGPARASASVKTDEAGGLLVEVSATGRGFNGVSLSIDRRLGGSSFEESLGQVRDGSLTFSWKPVLRNFDETLVCTRMSFKQLKGFLEVFGANIKGDFAGPKMTNDFILCDGPAIEYYLYARGNRFPVPEVDRTRLFLTE